VPLRAPLWYFAAALKIPRCRDKARAEDAPLRKAVCRTADACQVYLTVRLLYSYAG